MTKGGHGGMGYGGVLESRRRFPVIGNDSMRFRVFPVKPIVLHACIEISFKNVYSAFVFT